MGVGVSPEDDNEADKGVNHAEDHGIGMDLSFAENKGVDSCISAFAENSGIDRSQS